MPKLGSSFLYRGFYSDIDVLYVPYDRAQQLASPAAFDLRGSLAWLRYFFAPQVWQASPPTLEQAFYDLCYLHGQA